MSEDDIFVSTTISHFQSARLKQSYLEINLDR